MIHFFYLIGFALFTGIVFGAISAGDTKSKIIYGAGVILCSKCQVDLPPPRIIDKNNMSIFDLI